MRDFPLFPEQASGVARQVDWLFFGWSGVAAFFSALIAGLILYFMVRYRRRPGTPTVGTAGRPPMVLEITWIAIPFVIVMTMFAWGTKVYYEAVRPPAGAVEFFVVGKQWMWKMQHPDGKREINDLHVPVHTPVKITLTSEDVIHSFYVPAMRVKTDVIPGRYTTLWFEADKVGSYHIFCAEYCGAEHSRMTGRLIVMEPHEYASWLAGAVSATPAVSSGEDLFQELSCNTCHRPDTAARAPVLTGILGKEVLLADGKRVRADETYLRESIVNPAAKVVAGYQPIMPTFKGQVSEAELMEIITYIKAMGAGEGEG